MVHPWGLAARTLAVGIPSAVDDAKVVEVALLAVGTHLSAESLTPLAGGFALLASYIALAMVPAADVVESAPVVWNLG